MGCHGVGCHALLNPGLQPRSPTLQVDYFLSEPPGKPENIGVGSLSLLWGNFPTQESNQDHPTMQVDSLPAELPGKPKVKSLNCVWLFATLWTVAYQAPLSMGFSRQEYWSGLLFPSPGDHPYPGIEPGSPTLWAGALLSEPPRKPKPHTNLL